HTGGAADNVGFGQRRIEDAVGAELELQASGQFEDSSLAFDQFLLEILFAAGVGYILSEDDDTLIAVHLVAQRGVDEVRHGLVWRGLVWRVGGALAIGRRLGGGQRRMSFKRRRSGIEIGRVYEVVDRVRLRYRGFEGAVGIGLHQLIDFLLDFVDPVFVENSLPQQEQLQPVDRVARGIGLALAVGPVKALVIGERVGIRTDDMGMDKRGPMAGAA